MSPELAVTNGFHDARLMVVDDEPSNVKLLVKLLQNAGYTNVHGFESPAEALEDFDRSGADLLLLDLNMPEIDGFETMQRINARGLNIPPSILVLTAQSAREHRIRALDYGARDYVTKPFDRVELLARVRNLLEIQVAQRYMHGQNAMLERKVRERTQELRETRLQIVHRLGRAAEFRDNETGYHILRMSHTSALLARAIGWNEKKCELMLHASPMHDIGKIGIPDHILLKPGRLDAAEWEIMKTHTTIGARILEGDDSDLLTMAGDIAIAHHEKWDGSGYPNGLRGDAISLSGRIVALADVFDALTSERPYKKAWSIDDAVAFIRDNRGVHFDPQLVEHFLQFLPEVLEIRAQYAEPEEDTTAWQQSTPVKSGR